MSTSYDLHAGATAQFNPDLSGTMSITQKSYGTVKCIEFPAKRLLCLVGYVLRLAAQQQLDDQSDLDMITSLAEGKLR